MKSWKTEKLIFIDPEAKSAFQSLSYKDFEIGVFSNGNSGALGRLAAQSSGVKKRYRAFFHSCRHAPRGAPGHKQLLKSFFHLFCFSALFNMLQYLQEQHHSTEHERRGGILGRTLKCDAALSSTNKWDIEPGLLDLAISQFLFSHRRQTLLLFLYSSVRVVIFL